MRLIAIKYFNCLTALIYIYIYIYIWVLLVVTDCEWVMTVDAGSPSLLILLDLTAAFDTVDHTILLEHLHTTIGLSGSAIKWFQSYRSGRTEYVSLVRCKSRLLPVSQWWEVCPRAVYQPSPREHSGCAPSRSSCILQSGIMSQVEEKKLWSEGQFYSLMSGVTAPGCVQMWERLTGP